MRQIPDVIAMQSAMKENGWIEKWCFSTRSLTSPVPLAAIVCEAMSTPPPRRASDSSPEYRNAKRILNHVLHDRSYSKIISDIDTHTHIHTYTHTKGSQLRSVYERMRVHTTHPPPTPKPTASATVTYTHTHKLTLTQGYSKSSLPQ
jgi:hypothetical protein